MLKEKLKYTLTDNYIFFTFKRVIKNTFPQKTFF